MRPLAALLTVLAGPALACGEPVCLVPQETLALEEVVTFDNMASGFGPGREVEDVLVAEGAQFGERFLGQTRRAEGTFDRIDGAALGPLTVLAGEPGETLSITRLLDTNVLNGLGPEGFPRTEATGEGAISVLFDRDQSALGFDIRGGEAASAWIIFFRRDGSVIHQMTLGPLAEDIFGFERAGGVGDIAGFLLTNDDPEGLALDNVRFGRPLQLG